MKKTFFLVCIIYALFTTPTMAGTITVLNENDGFLTRNDRDYTQGFRASYLDDNYSSDSIWQSSYELIGDYTPFFKGGERQVAYIIGQNMFTPNNKDIANPSTDDRPYAGWLYGGVSLLEDHGGDSLDHVELQVGVVGPWAQAEETQNAFHRMFDHDEVRGWDYQIRNEPGFMLSAERSWRFHALLLEDAAFGIEAIPQVGATVGNIMTYAQSGLMLRLGSNLKADYGTARIRPNFSGTDYFNPDMMDGWLGWNIYAAVQGRAVARNIFLDGNTFGASREIGRDIFAGNAVVGASIYGSYGPRVDAAMIFCRQEANVDRGCSKYGGVNLGWSF